MNIKHWEQYLTPLHKTRLNLKPDTFKNVLKWNHIILPIFQRKYCWTQKQITRYWNDLLYISLNIQNLGHRKHRRRHDNAHSLGKIVTFEEKDKNKITVIDGQQRLTTTIIILISIKQLLSKNNYINNTLKDKLIKKINAILFRKKANPNNIIYNEGDSLDFVRFLPTYLDRSYFYDMIFNKDNVNNNGSNVALAKQYFDSELLKYNDCNKIFAIYDKLLTQFKFVYVGIPLVESSYAKHSIYQWFFERELFIEKCGGDRPGYSQTVTDLFRNYVLSFFINDSMNSQQKIYKLWINIEKSYNNINDLNQYLISLINTKKSKSYDIYRDLVRFIEVKLKKYKKNQYKLYIKQFIINLKCNINDNNNKNNKIVIYGYLHCIEVVNHFALLNVSNITELVNIITKYMFISQLQTKITSLTQMESKINKELKIIKD